MIGGQLRRSRVDCDGDREAFACRKRENPKQGEGSEKKAEDKDTLEKV